MEYVLTKLATQLVYPLSIVIVLMLMGLLALARGRTRRAGAFVGAGVGLLWLASMPALGFVLSESLQSRYPPIPPEEAMSASAIVVLGGGLSPAAPPRNWMNLSESADRILHTARLYRAGKAPFIVATGGGGPQDSPQRPGEATADLLVEWGVPREAILVERKSRNTYQNALFAKQLLDAHGITGPVLLVTSARHMQRSVLIFESVGVEVIPAATDYSRGSVKLGTPMAWLPDAGTLRGTTSVFKEWLGIAVDRLRGRIRAAPE
jgi:uncharacterized SAM-binding protein YcdF (DUF218 family)